MKPRINITMKAWLKLQYLVNKVATEVAWYGNVQQDRKTNELTIVDIYVPKQEVGAAAADTLAEGTFEYSETLDNQDEFRYQGHSHVNMAVSPSGDDNKYRKQFADSVGDYFISAIHNKRGQYSLIVSLPFLDYEMDADYNVVYPKSGCLDFDSIYAEVDAQISKNVSTRYRNPYSGERYEFREDSFLPRLYPGLPGYDKDNWRGSSGKYDRKPALQVRI